mmetsp:Transcript_31740/g.69352  ORF Transcript_31740/g.69352 Transcript_31740/m.69352 type:complete len:432 (-) Transcript_31740:85-1380(-)
MALPGLAGSTEISQRPVAVCPGRRDLALLRLRAVNPRYNMERRDAGLREAESLGCSKFVSSCRGASREEHHNGVEYKMLFQVTEHGSTAPPFEESEEEDDEDEEVDKAETKEPVSGLHGLQEHHLRTRSMEEQSEVGSEGTFVDDDAMSVFSGYQDSEMDVGDGLLKSAKARRARASRCNRKNHPALLRDRVYAKACRENKVKLNTGIRNLLTNPETCFCSLYIVSFRNLLLGDRGVLGLLSLLKSGRRLRCLNLAGNQLGDAGVRASTRMFRQAGVLARLAVLDLSHNPIPSASIPELTKLITLRPRLLLLGLEGTALKSIQRQSILLHSLGNFSNAEPMEMTRAWQMSMSRWNFADRELWVQSTAVLEANCTKEQLAECENAWIRSMPSFKSASVIQMDTSSPERVNAPEDVASPNLTAMGLRRRPSVA